ncbi:MAG: S-layer homology domain-containing protein [Clostridiales bacterium]|uniref:S-layer homology domain-containing protein n=1 Tax=Flavonifractor porci TaxID=3133422 RepID=UPI0030A2B14B|nr:S-layer homology domain-containing protein [Clostridiales bacterium]
MKKRVLSLLLVLVLALGLLPLETLAAGGELPQAVTEPPEGQEWQMISTAEELAALSEQGGSGYYRLANDIEDYVGCYSMFAKTFDGVLDGNGYTVTFAAADQYPNPLIDTLGPNGVVQNLGVKGTIANVPLVSKLSGKLINCYSWAESSYGGLVYEMLPDSAIVNCYVSRTPGGYSWGGLVNTGRGGQIFNSYWPDGEAVADNDGTAVTDSRTVSDQKSEAFRELLNEHRSGGMEWHQSAVGLPWLGEQQDYVESTFYPVVMTDLITEETTTINSADQMLTIGVFGLPDGDVATLELQGYEGDVEWDVASDQDNAPIIVYGQGRVWARKSGTVTVTATCGENTQSFRLKAVVPEFQLKLKIDGQDYTGKNYKTPGSGTFSMVPYVVVSGEEREANNALFAWESSAPHVINVDSQGWVNIKQEGTANLTAELNGVSASVTVEAGYTAIDGIECTFEGEYTIHRRNPNSIGQNGTPGEASFNPLRHLKDGEEWVGSEHHIADITPEDATYAGSYVTVSDNNSVIEFQGSLVQSLIPMKAGSANITVTTADPKLEQQFSNTKKVTLSYLNPLKEVTAAKTELTVKVGQSIDAGLIFTGKNDNAWPERYPGGLHVSESYINWEKISGDGEALAYRSYPVLMPTDEEYSLEEGTVSNDQWLIKGISQGTVVLKGTAKDTTNGEQTITLTITVEAGDQGPALPVEEQVSAALKKTAAYELNGLTEKTPAFLDEWGILGLARAGIEVPVDFYETYYASAYQAVQKQKDTASRPWDNKVTETQRLALALTAIGKDPTDVDGVNLLDYSWNKGKYWNGAALGDMQGCNELIYALLATNAHDSFQQPESVSMTRQQMIEKLLGNYQAPEGGFGLSGPAFDVDITGMALQALAPYYSNDAVKTAVDKAVTHLSQAQGTDGSYGNPESTSQVIVALAALGIDPDTDPRFVKTGSSLVDGLLMYGLEDGSFRHSMNGGSDGMATEQALYTLAALNRFYAEPRANSLYNMNDVSLGGDTGAAVTGVTLTPASAELKAGKTVQLYAMVIPTSAENKAVTFSSDHPQVASVSETGLVTAVSEGKAKITVTTKDGGKTASAEITVTKAGEGKPEDKATVTLSIDKLTINKGYVLNPTKVEINKGETVWDVLKRELDHRGIDCDYSIYEQYNSVYVESIDGDGEFDHGPGSGWKYSVDGVYPDYGCSLYKLSGGEVIKWLYTTNLGADLGDDPGAGMTGKPEQGGSATLRPVVKPDKNGHAQITMDTDQMKAAIAQVKVGGERVVAIAPKITGTATKITVEVPVQSLKDMVKNTDAALVVQSDIGSLSVPNGALGAVVRQAGGNTATFSLESKNTADIRKQMDVSQMEDAEAVEVTIASNQKELTAFDGKSLTITIPVSGSTFVASEAYKVIVLGHGGTRENVSGICVKQNDKLSVQIEMSLLGTFVVTAQKTMPFTDVPGHWAAEGIAWAYGNDLMNGTGETTFAPNDRLNRAMLTAILYRLAGKPAVTGESKAFMDVVPDTWYTSSVAWASANGVVNGMGDGTFAPMDAITREQLAVMLYRYAQYIRLDTSAKGDLSKFTDGSQVSSWASEAMAWAVGTGMISGKTANIIDPSGTATRAETATILMRFAALLK